jgi:dipeptidyl aminopeptidase/acylaminoacyl peptidase
MSDPFVTRKTARSRIDGGAVGLLSASSRRPEIVYQLSRYDQQGRPRPEEGLHMMDLSSGVTREIRWPGHAITSAVYSPGDDRLAVSGLPSGGFPGVDDELAVIVANPGDSHRQFQDTGVKGFPWAWSPDGNRVAGYSISREGSERERALPHLFVFDLKTGTCRDSSAPGGTADEMGAWSADSQRFVFSSNRKGMMQLYMFNVSTGEAVPFHASDGGDHFPEWSPDGRVIVFMRDSHGKRELHLLDSDGLNARPAVHQPEGDVHMTSRWIEMPHHELR